MIQSGRPPLEEGQHDDDAQLAGQRAERFGRGTGNGFCLVENGGVFRLAEVQSVVQFLQDDELRTGLGCLADAGLQLADVRFPVRRIALLD